MLKQYLKGLGNAVFGRATTQLIVNKFNEATFIGIPFTPYDPKNPTYVEEGYNGNADVYAIISQAARKLSSVPCYLKKINDKEAKRQVESLIESKRVLSPAESFRKSKLEQKAYDQTKEIAEPLDKPNYYQSWTEFYELWTTMMMLTGNAYIYLLAPKEGMNKGQPFQVYLLPAQFTEIVLKQDFKDTINDPRELQTIIDHYMVTIGNRYIEFEAENVIHTKLPNPNYDLNGAHLYGQSPLRAALKDLQTGNEANKQNVKTLKNGGAYGFVHGTDANNPLNPEQAKQLKERLVEMEMDQGLMSRFAGSSAPIGFTRLSLTTDELKPFEYLKYSQKQLCNVFGWSDKLLNNDDGANYDNVDTAHRMAISNNTQPYAKLLAEALNRYYYPRFKGYENVVKIFDISELPEMQTDMKAMTDWLNSAMDRAVISPDEYRLALKYPEIKTPAMQTRYIKTGYTPIDDLTLIEDQPLDDNKL